VKAKFLTTRPSASHSFSATAELLVTLAVINCYFTSASSSSATAELLVTLAVINCYFTSASSCICPWKS